MTLVAFISMLPYFLSPNLVESSLDRNGPGKSLPWRALATKARVFSTTKVRVD